MLIKGTNILYDAIGRNYNATRKADPFISSKLSAYLLANGTKNGTFLDLGCGTGNYTFSLDNEAATFYGADPSNEMLHIAKLKSDQINWVQASAENLPFTDALFDGVLATLTIHHWANLSKGLKEVYRVLKPQADLVVFTSTKEQMNGYWLNNYFPKMMSASIAKMPGREQILSAAENAGFTLTKEEAYFIKPDLKDLFLYSGKHNPTMYLSAKFRKGISSFANLTTKAELATGLASLKDDINTGAFQNIKARYENPLGDYAFLVFGK